MGSYKLSIATFTAIDTLWWPDVAACQLKLDLIKSPTTLKHGRYTYKELEQWHISYYTIVTNLNGLLQAVDCDIHSDRYDIVLESCCLSTQIGPHQVTYDAVAWPIHI